MSATRKHIAITGATGLIGRHLVTSWRASGRYDVVGIARRPSDVTDVVADLTDQPDLIAAFAGVDTVVHMGGSSAVSASWDDVLRNNIIGTRNVYEAAHAAGVHQVVYASSNHAVGWFELANAPDLFELDDPRQIDHRSEIRPDSYYGVSKVVGEAIARFFAEQHGLHSVCLRIGGVRADDDPTLPANLWAPGRDREPGIEQQRKRMRAVWLSQNDCRRLVEAAIDADPSFAIVYGTSNNPRQIWDLAHARETIGFVPNDAAPADIFPPRPDDPT